MTLSARRRNRVLREVADLRQALDEASTHLDDACMRLDQLEALLDQPDSDEVAQTTEPAPPGRRTRFFFAVAVAGPSGPHRGWGVYRDYESYADAVRDRQVWWSGRGRFTWASGAVGQMFSTEQQAIDWLMAERSLSAQSEIPFHPDGLSRR